MAQRASDHWIQSAKRIVQECRYETGMPFYIFIELLAKKYDIVDDYTLAKAIEAEYQRPLIEDIKHASTN